MTSPLSLLVLPPDSFTPLVIDGFVSHHELPIEQGSVVMRRYRQVRDEEVCWVTHIWLDCEINEHQPGGAA